MAFLHLPIEDRGDIPNATVFKIFNRSLPRCPTRYRIVLEYPKHPPLAPRPMLEELHDVPRGLVIGFCTVILLSPDYKTPELTRDPIWRRAMRAVFVTEQARMIVADIVYQHPRTYVWHSVPVSVFIENEEPGSNDLLGTRAIFLGRR